MKSSLTVAVLVVVYPFLPHLPKLFRTKLLFPRMGMDHPKLQLSKLQSAKKLRSQFVNRYPFKDAIRKRGRCAKNLHDRCQNSLQERYVTMRQRQRAPMWQNKCRIRFVNL